VTIETNVCPWPTAPIQEELKRGIAIDEAFKRLAAVGTVMKNSVSPIFRDVKQELRRWLTGKTVETGDIRCLPSYLLLNHQPLTRLSGEKPYIKVSSTSPTGVVEITEKTKVEIILKCPTLP